MKLLLAALAALLMSACGSAPPANPAAAQAYPVWLEMKPGYAEACISAGGCVPMTQGELHQMAMEIMQRTMQSCRRTSDI